MNETETILNWYLFIINLIGFLVMGEDKRRARQHQYRISERTLWQLAGFGGATAMTIAMKLFHHKTKHQAFKIGFPLLALLQFALYLYFFVI
ncbi:DUF1294 domain-containing protein [Neobacillus sp. LXY-4]|uniref:DUF1294 domain-containing protein n=1 Tax=Neobacillus sp. LXY-4 TaxID=3379826 RepID=UPI003EE39AD4